MTTESTPPTPAPPPSASSGESFVTTRWTQVGRAKAKSPEGQRALFAALGN